MSAMKRVRESLQRRRQRRQDRRGLRADRSKHGRGPHDAGAAWKDTYKAGPGR